jgi:superfamily II DNA/RNA helicase
LPIRADRPGAVTCAPIQERTITNVTNAGALAGTEEASFETSSAEQAPSEAIATPTALPGFDSLGLSPEVLKAVLESGYTTPTPIQAQGIPIVLQRRDIIGIAQTGTGKTASFTLPMIEMLARGRAKARMPRSLILEPTRELAAQVAESFEKYGKYNKLSMALLIGGVSFDEQDRKLDRGVDVLIATPGRLLDHFGRGKLMLSQVNILVIDEADRMLDMGFIPDVEEICKKLPFTRQTLFYSATMPPEIQRLTDQFLHNPVRVEVSRPATTAINITQEVIDVPANDWAKREALRRLIRETGEMKNAIIFCNRKRDVDVVAKSLRKHGFSVAPLHGDLDQSVRTKTLEGFKNNEVQILVASDVAARGLDIPAVSHIFNFDVPFHADDYVHRIGRTGRAGRSGHAFMLATSRDFKSVEAIERLTGNKLIRRTLEGLAEATQERPQGESRGRGGDRNKRGPRDRKHGDHHRNVPHHGHHASMEPSEVPVTKAAAPVQAAEIAQPVQSAPAPEAPRQFIPREHTPRPHTPRGERHQQKRNAPKHAPRQQHAKPQQQQRSESKLPDAHQLPAFLMRPINLPKVEPKTRKKKEDAEN